MIFNVKYPSRVRSRPRSSKRDNNLAFPCPDCHKRSFATEAGLYAHRFLSEVISRSKSVSIAQDPDLWFAGQGEAHKPGLQVQLLPEGFHITDWAGDTHVR